MMLNNHSKKIINRMGLNVCNKTGVVLSTGKFESEMYYVPVFWDYFLEGSYDDESNLYRKTFRYSDEEVDGEIVFNLNDDDISNFPELKGFNKLKLIVCEQGFVYGRVE